MAATTVYSTLLFAVAVNVLFCWAVVLARQNSLSKFSLENGHAFWPCDLTSASVIETLGVNGFGPGERLIFEPYTRNYSSILIDVGAARAEAH